MSSILNAAIGVAVVFAVFALLVSGLQEAWASLINRRGRMLVKALEMLLGSEAESLVGGSGLLGPLNNATNSIKRDRTRTPSYVPSWLFATSVLSDHVLDVVASSPPDQPVSDDADQAQTQANEANQAPAKPTVTDALTQLLTDAANLNPKDTSDKPSIWHRIWNALQFWKQAATTTGPETLAGVISGLAQEVGTDRAKLETALANWFDLYMQRVSGWYTRNTRWILFGIAVLVALGANVDAIAISRNVVDNPGTQTTLVQLGSSVQQCPTGSSATASSSLDCAQQDISQLPISQLDLFWSAACPAKGAATPSSSCTFWARHGLDDFWGWFYKIVGLLLGAFAISLGAPFWFDLIGRGLSLRGTGPEPTSGVNSNTVPAGDPSPPVFEVPPAQQEPAPPPTSPAAESPPAGGDSENATPVEADDGTSPEHGASPPPT
jgi:hypothetical protein